MESEKPMEQRMYKGTIHCCKTIVATEGVQGLYKGIMADIVRGGFAAMVPLIYTKIKDIMAE
jgi:solute carrier family 25 (adenine nucleotide translocator) protein 4/5/6/31